MNDIRNKNLIPIEKDSENFIAQCGNKVMPAKIVYEYIPSKEEIEEGAKNFLNILRKEDTPISEIFYFYFRDYESMQHDELDQEENMHFLKLYGFENIDEALKLLEIHNNEHRWQMAGAMIRAAHEYFRAEQHNQTKHAKKEYKDILKQLSTSLNKTLSKIYPNSDIEEKDYQYADIYLEKVQEQIEEDEYLATNITRSDLIAILEIMADTAKEESQSPSVKTGTHYPSLTLWFNNILCAWQEYSSLPLKEAKYYKDIGYVSDQITILEKLLKLIKPDIENSQIGYELRKFLSDKTPKTCSIDFID